MPKVSKVGKFRATAKASSFNSPLTSSKINNNKEETADNVEKEKETLSRGQRKRLAKREQYLKREKMVLSSLRLQRLEEQKGKLDGLDAIREALPTSKSLPATAVGDTSQPPTRPIACNTNKSKKTLANSEISHMGLVLDHPAFKENPFAAIQQHLRNTLASDVERLQQESLQRSEEEKELEAKKKEERKDRLRDAKFSKRKSGKRAQPKALSRSRR